MTIPVTPPQNFDGIYFEITEMRMQQEMRSDSLQSPLRLQFGIAAGCQQCIAFVHICLRVCTHIALERRHNDEPNSDVPDCLACPVLSSVRFTCQSRSTFSDTGLTPLHSRQNVLLS